VPSGHFRPQAESDPQVGLEASAGNGGALCDDRKPGDDRMSNYELLMIILTVIGLLIATAKLFKR